MPHGTDVPRIIFDLFVMFAAAKIVGELFERIRQPAVVGEIAVGMLLGPYALGVVSGAEFHVAFAEIGVIVLLFTVGLETRVSDVASVGRTALLVALLGIVVPFVLGGAVMQALGGSRIEALFVATALIATSVGITARVLSDMGKSTSRVAYIILGAAVIDDILGMLVLAVVAGVARGSLSYVNIAVIFAQALALVAFVILVGTRLVRRFSVHLSALHIRNPEFAVALILCLGLAALASRLHLAAIIGAFLAGMAFAEAPQAQQVHRRMEPLYDLLVPLFFVIVGTRVDLPALLRPDLLVIGLIITAVAIIGKLVGCGLGALTLGRREALTVGVGMAPRGEVGIVVAMVGLAAGVMSRDLYSVIILMSVLTTFFAPPLLRRLLTEPQPEEEASADAAEAPPVTAQGAPAPPLAGAERGRTEGPPESE